MALAIRFYRKCIGVLMCIGLDGLMGPLPGPAHVICSFIAIEQLHVQAYFQHLPLKLSTKWRYDKLLTY